MPMPLWGPGDFGLETGGENHWALAEQSRMPTGLAALAAALIEKSSFAVT